MLKQVYTEDQKMVKAQTTAVPALMLKHNIISHVRQPRPKAWNIRRCNLCGCESWLFKMKELELMVCKV